MALLQPIAGHAYYLPGANNLGVVLTGDGGAVAIDTGLDKDTGRLIRKALDEAKLQLRAIISTHHHADHIGGNDFLLRNIPGVEVYAPRLEAALIEHPILEPIYLSMGAHPLASLQTKWLMAKGAPVHYIIEPGAVEIAGVPFEIIGLPGHSINQIGVAVDGVCFAADGFFGPAVLQKHGIPYAHNIAEQLASLQRLAQRPELYFLPGHGDLTPQALLADALATNQNAIERSSEVVQTALATPGDLFAVARRVQQALGLSFGGIPQYAIFVSAVAAHLNYLETQGRARVTLEDAGMLWSAA
jgi:glyoxylase-like metal-dependent hydrolase (beta-lactamase superfamily II)